MAWGQAMEVPDIILNFDNLVSPFTSEIGEIWDHAAMMSTPGAAISGYKDINNEKYIIISSWITI